MPNSNFLKNSIEHKLSQLLVGQDAAIEKIVPYFYAYDSGLSAAGRPAGNFLLLGPSGTGKTKLVEALAEIVHKDPSKILKINCGDFHAGHDAARLTGAPPSYLGHRDTEPMLSQENIDKVTSEYSRLSFILFDEIEKAPHTIHKALLNIMDKGKFQLGDNKTADFQNAMIFMTANVGAESIKRILNPRLGFKVHDDKGVDIEKLQRAGIEAAKKQFTPEFYNRIDEVAAFEPLSEESIMHILKMALSNFNVMLAERLRAGSIALEYESAACHWLRNRGFSTEYGGRELNRVINRYIRQPIARMLFDATITPGDIIRVSVNKKKDELVFKSVTESRIVVAA